MVSVIVPEIDPCAIMPLPMVGDSVRMLPLTH